jgi:RNA polymerase sigma-70 factor (ECF subfamily)
MTWEIGLPLEFGATFSDHPTDTELLVRCRQGQVHAFKQLYNMYSPRMKSLAFHLLGNEGDAEDAVQETFFKVFKGAKGNRDHCGNAGP